MEHLLITWLEDCNQKWIPIGTNITAKAFSLFLSLKGNKFKGDATVFSASRGWFQKFKAQTGIHNVKLTKKTVSANKDAAATFYALIQEYNYDDCHIFNMDETVLYWKQMLSRTFLAKN